MKNIKKLGVTRRKFIGATSSMLVGITAGIPSIIAAPSILKNFKKPNSVINGVQLGVITYSFRSMPDQSAEATLQYVLDCGISAIELMGDPAETYAGRAENPVNRRRLFQLFRKTRGEEGLTEDETKEMQELRALSESYNKEVSEWRKNAEMKRFEKMGKMYADAGVRIYGFKPSTFGVNNSDAEIEYGFRAAKALGANHVTLEHPGNDDHTLKLGGMAKKHKVYVAYHGHEQQTPTLWNTALEQSEYNAMNLDVGHYVAAGNPSPLDLINQKYDRISSIHVKDRQNPENGKANLKWGEGDTPIAEILQLLRDKKYRIPASVELEYQIPEGSDAVKEVRKCIEFSKGVLES